MSTINIRTVLFSVIFEWFNAYITVDLLMSIF